MNIPNVIGCLALSMGVMLLAQNRAASYDSPDAVARRKQIEPLMAGRGTTDWRKVPSTGRPDDIAPQVRAARNQYWDRRLPATNVFVSPGQRILSLSEFSTNKSLVWLVGKFISYRVLEPYRGRGPYTEIRLAVQEVLSDGANSGTRPGAAIDVDETGGTIVDESSAPHQYSINLNTFPFQPQHSYIISLSYQEKGRFFIEEDKWDITSGIAMPDSGRTADVFVAGRAEIGGHPAKDALSELGSAISKNEASQ